MPYPIEVIDELIRTRRSIFPGFYNDREISNDTILEILENANWAPNHKKTEPWRFIIIKGSAKEPLADYMQEYYQENTSPENFREKKYQKIRKNILKTPCLVAICMYRDPEKRVPEWEEIAAVACAVQNMWLSCHARNIGSYWSTPRSILHADKFFKLDEHTQCLGLMYMGYYDHLDFPAERRPIQEKIRWMEG
jgi:nitroreductase